MNDEQKNRRSFVITLGLVTTAAAVSIDLSLPAIPAMVDALQTNLSRGQQIVGVFMVGMALGQIPWGLFSDRLGRLPVLYTGMAVFTLAAMVAAMADRIELLLAARLVQGIGASAAIVLSRAIVRDVAHGMEAARLMSVMTMIFTAAPVIAPSIGAVLVKQWGWRAPFTAIVVLGVLIIAGIRMYVAETHTPNVDGHPVRQLARSFREFFSHRQSVWGLLLVIPLPAGFMSIITVSAALAVEIYGFSLQSYGLIFACAGLSILIGAGVNRLLVTRLDQLQLIAFSAALIAIVGLQLLLIAWLNSAPFWWLWACVCLFMFTVAILMPAATVMALDPLPRIAGVASSITGTMQNIFGAAGAMLGAVMYNGSVARTVVIMGLASATIGIIALMKPLIAPEPLVRHAHEPARD